jgi:hypothetical protein
LIQNRKSKPKRRLRDKLASSLDEPTSPSPRPPVTTEQPKRSRNLKSRSRTQLIEEDGDVAAAEVDDIKKIRKKRVTKESQSKSPDPGHANEAFELDQEAEPVRKGRRVKKKVSKETVGNSDVDSDKQEDKVYKDIHEDKNILAVVIHQTDKLRTDINMYRPVVRVHIVDLDLDGQYVLKTKRCLLKKIIFYLTNSDIVTFL